MGSKSSTSEMPAYYYESLAASNTEIASMEQQTSDEQLQWSKDQYNDFAPYLKNYEDASAASMEQQNTQAKSEWDTYENQYAPLETKFVDEASNWNSPDRANQQAGAAGATVAGQYDQARQAATANLESYGIDPSQTRFAALDLGTRVSQAAATAGAETQSRVNTEATGLSLQGEAINVGRGYSSAVSQAYSGATQAGSSGVNSGLSTSSTYGNLMGTGTQWEQQANNTRSSTASALGGYGNFEVGRTNADNGGANSTGSTIGSAIGTIAMIAALA